MSASTRLPYLATAALSGLLFGAGLYVSQMVDPLKVLRFLDFTAIPNGGWDPSLAFVIVPAIAVMFVAVRIGRRRSAPAFDARFHEPEFKKIDTPLVAGAALFGIGWALAGFCPGPALVALGSGSAEAGLFVVAMLAGGWLQRAVVTPRKG